MSELPRGWVQVPLSEVASSMLGKMLDRSKHTTGTKLPYLRNVNVRWHEFALDDVYEMYFEERELDRYAVEPGDVLICEGGEPGRAAVWRGPPNAVKYQKALHRVRPRASLLPEWLVYSLRRDAQRGALSEMFTGTTIKHFTGRSLEGYPVRIPPLPEQRRIVAKIEALQARSRAAREALDAVGPLLDKFRQSVLAAAFRGDLTADWRAKHPNVEPASALLERIRKERRGRWETDQLEKMQAKGKPPKDDRWKAKYEEPKPVETEGLPELPGGWCWASLEELLSQGLSNGRSVPTQTDGFPVLRLTALRNRRIDLRERKCGAWTAAEAQGFLVQQGDFLVARGNGSLSLVGRGGLVQDAPDPVAFPDTMIRVRVGFAMTAPYLATVWDSPLLRQGESII